MKTRRLGKSDLVVSAVGLGCMSMTPFYGAPDEAESVATLRRAVDVGVTLATKCGVYAKHEGGSGHRADAEYVRQCCDASLHRLRTDGIDLWYVHRVDPETPVEETIGAMGRCVAAGKVRHSGSVK